MDGYSISQVAERTGFSASTLRFYEQSGLVRPDRTPAGYRSYGDDHVEQLAFIGRAKGFGLSLEEITELLALFDEEQCAPVQGRLKAIVDAKIAGAEARIAELTSFAAELRRVSDTLDRHTPDGPCDDTCGCTTDAEADGVALTLGRRADAAETVIACTLDAARAGNRLEEWHDLVTAAAGVDVIPGGARLRFGRDVDVAPIAALAAAEQDCCRFFTFALRLETAGVALDVTAPPDGQPIIKALLRM